MGAERSSDLPTLWATIDRLNVEVAQLRRESAELRERLGLLGPCYAPPVSRADLVAEIQRCTGALSRCHGDVDPTSSESDLAHAKLALEVFDERYRA